MSPPEADRPSAKTDPVPPPTLIPPTNADLPPLAETLVPPTVAPSGEQVPVAVPPADQPFASVSGPGSGAEQDCPYRNGSRPKEDAGQRVSLGDLEPPEATVKCSNCGAKIPQSASHRGHQDGRQCGKVTREECRRD